MDIFERSSKSILFQVKYQHLKCASKDCKSQSFKVVVFFRNYGIRKNKIKDTPIIKSERSKLLQNPKELQGTSKAIRNDEWLKLKRVTWQKKVLLFKKKTAFLSGIFLQIWPFVIRYGINIFTKKNGGWRGPKNTFLGS